MPAPNEPLSATVKARGEIGPRGLARMLLALGDAGHTGTLRLQNGQVRKDIYLREGRPVGAMSNLRSEALGSLLKAAGVLDDAQLAQVLAEMQRTSRKMGEVLLTIKWLAPGDLLNYLLVQARRRVVEALGWRQGIYELTTDLSYDSEIIEQDVGFPRVVFAGLLHTTRPEEAVAWLFGAHPGAIVQPVSAELERHRAALVQVFGEAIVTLLSRPVEVAKLAGRSDRAQVAVSVQALECCGLLGLALASASKVAAARAVPALGLLVDALAQPRRPATFDDDLMVVGDGDDTDAVPQEFADAGDSGVVPLDSMARARLLAVPTEGAALPAQPSSRPDAVAAELHFAEARARLAAGDREGALARLQAAHEAAPHDAAYLALYGWTLYQARGVAAREPATLAVTQALALDPQLADGLDYLGRLRLAAQDHAGARMAFAALLEREPTRQSAFEALAALLEQQDELGALETLYRKTLAALGQDRIEIRRRLWRGLAELYDGRLQNPEAARMAYEMAARLSPDDLDLQRKAVALSADSPARWKQRAAALIAAWRLQPHDRAPAAALLEVMHKAGKRDAAGVIATVMVLRGADAGPEREIAERFRPRGFTMLSSPLSAEVLATFKHPDESPAIEALLAALVEAGAMTPPMAAPQSPALPLPAAVGKLAAYTAEVLGSSAPTVTVAGAGRTLRMLAPRVFELGAALAQSGDSFDLVFRLASAVSLSAPGRWPAQFLRGRELRAHVMAAIAFTAGTRTSDDAEVVALVGHLRALPEPAQLRIKAATQRLLAGQGSLNLSRWQRAVRASADRLGLLLGRDLFAAAQALRERDAAALDDLLDFALSFEHLDVRAQLAVVVAPGNATAAPDNRRGAERIDLEVEINLSSDSNLFTGILQDISTGGVFVVTSDLRRVGERLTIELRLPDVPEPVKVNTEVRWVREAGAGGLDEEAPGMGLRFIDPDARVIALCQRFMAVRDSLFYELD